MEQANTLTIRRAVGAFMIVLALINGASVLAGFGPDGPMTANESEVNGNMDTARNEVIQDVGGITSPMGMMTAALTPILTVIGVMLIMGRRWEMFAALALGLDVIIKLANIVSQLTIGEGIGDALLPIAFIVVDVAAAVMIYRTWHERKQQTA